MEESVMKIVLRGKHPMVVHMMLWPLKKKKGKLFIGIVFMDYYATQSQHHLNLQMAVCK